MSNPNDMPEDQLEALRKEIYELHNQLEKKSYEYFCGLPLGNDRIKASEYYNEIRTTRRLTRKPENDKGE